jgi:hypothetical protein
MTIAAQRVLATFEALPEDDKQAVVVEILRRAAENEYPSLDEADLLLAADQVFLDLDRREDQD